MILTAKEIRDLATFCGFTVDTCGIDLDTEITIRPCPSSGIRDTTYGSRRHYKNIAYFTEYSDEGVLGLGDEL